MHLRDRRGIFFRRQQGRGIHDVRNRRGRQAGGKPRELAQIKSSDGTQAARVEPKQRFAFVHVRQAEMAGAVEAAGADQRRIDIFYIVGRAQHDDPRARREAVQLDQHGIDDAVVLRFAGGIAATAFAQPIDLVDEDNARRLLARQRKQLSDPAHPDAEKHVGEIPAGERNERHARLAGHGARE